MDTDTKIRAKEKSTLRIKARKLGAISHVTSLLSDLEYAYNNIYVFIFLVDGLANGIGKRLSEASEIEGYFGESMKDFNRILKTKFSQKEILEEFIFRSFYFTRPHLLDLQSRINIQDVILPEGRLYLSKVNIQSPGWWEFIGNFSPLQQIREYLKDRHERNKDRAFRNRHEEELGDLDIELKRYDIINARIQVLHALGYSQDEIKQIVMAMVIQPLDRLGKHQDNGQIEGPEN